MSYILYKPCTNKERTDFIFKYNQDCFQEGYNCRIEETDEAIFALEENELLQDGEVIINPEWEQIELERARANKYNEALEKAYEYEQGGTVEYKNCVFEMSLSNRHNLDNTQEALEKSGQTETTWNDKNDELVTLTVEDIQYIRLNLILGTIKKLWIVDYPSYKLQIQNAQTTEELNEIEIDYDKVDNE